jgi:hypothetical protein
MNLYRTPLLSAVIGLAVTALVTTSPPEALAARPGAARPKLHQPMRHHPGLTPPGKPTGGHPASHPAGHPTGHPVGHPGEHPGRRPGEHHDHHSWHHLFGHNHGRYRENSYQGGSGGGSGGDSDGGSEGSSGSFYTGNPYLGGDTQASSAMVFTSMEESAPLQTKRYLRVSNQTGETLLVNVQWAEINQPLTWTIKPDQITYLAINDVPLAASQVRIWASSEKNLWNTYKDADLVLVPTPYRSDRLETFTYDFIQ